MVDKKKEINWMKIVFIFVLTLIVATASFFMITESARYYRFFYDESAWQPLYLAGLLELFVLVLAVIRIGTSKLFHATQKLIMVGIFSVIIFAAGMQAVNPTLESLAEISKKTEMAEILKQEYQNLQEDRQIFKDQKQRLNTAIAAKERRKLVEDMKTLFDQDVKTDKGRTALINIALLFSIRFLVQIANIFCASMLGVYFRGRGKQKKVELKGKDLVLAVHPKATCLWRGMHDKFCIFNDDKMTRGIGVGKTRKKAWEDAYKKLIR